MRMCARTCVYMQIYKKKCASPHLSIRESTCLWFHVSVCACVCRCNKRLISNISHEKTWTWLSKGNLKRETESLLIAAQNNAIRTNHIKARIDKTQQNSNCSLCGDRDETINHIISECCKIAQKEYKTRHDWMGKVIHWELCKKLKFDHTNKWYMHHPASVQENETHKLLWDFDTQTDHLISTRQPGLIIIHKKKEHLLNCGFCCPG